MSKEDWWWAKIFRGGDADPEKYIYVQYNVAVATLASKGWAIKMHWMQRPKKRVLVRKFYRRGNAGFSHPIWLCRFCRCWSTQYGRLQELPRFRAAELTPVTARVQYMRYTTLLHNIAQVGLLRKYRTPQVPIRKILSTLLGVSFILSPQNKYRTPTFPACKRFGWATSTSSCLRPIGCTWFGWPPCEGWRITWENI